MSDPLHKQRTLWLCTALHAFTHIYQVALIPLYLLIQKQYGLKSEGEATFLVTALSIAYFLPSYPMGVLSDTMSRKKLLGIGLAINGLAFIALAFAPNYTTAIICVIFAGFGGSFFHPSATALIAGLFPNETGKALGKVGIGAGMGFFIGPLYTGWRSASAGWQQAVFELGCFGFVGAILFLLYAKEHPVALAPKTAKQAPEKMFKTPLLWAFFLAASFAFCLRDFAGSGMASLGSLFLQHARGFDPKQTGLTLSCVYLAAVISNPLFGHFSDKGRIRWTAFVLIFAAIAIFIFPRVPSNYVVAALIMFGFFFMASYPIVEATLMESVHNSVRGRVFGCFITIGGLLGNLSHWIVGTWVKKLGDEASRSEAYFPLYNLLAGAVIVSLVGLGFLHAVRKRDSDVVPHDVSALESNS